MGRADHDRGGGPITRNARLNTPDTPGLGVTPDYRTLGDPVAVFA